MEKRKEYTDEEKRRYIWKMSLEFDERAKGHYVLARRPKHKTLVSILYFTGKKKSENSWWSFKASEAWIFLSKERAQEWIKKFKYDTSDFKIVKVL
jgi:hypothetical protein